MARLVPARICNMDGGFLPTGAAQTQPQMPEQSVVREEAGSPTGCSADATASSPGPAWADCRAVGSCQKGTGQAGEVSGQQLCRRAQPHQYQSKREVQGTGGRRDAAAAATLPGPQPMTTTALPLPCLRSQDHRCHWSGSLGIPRGTGGSRQPCQGGGASSHKEGHWGLPHRPFSRCTPQRGQRAGGQRGVGWLLPGRTHGGSSHALRAGGKSYPKTGVRTGAGLG